MKTKSNFHNSHSDSLSRNARFWFPWHKPLMQWIYFQIHRIEEVTSKWVASETCINMGSVRRNTQSTFVAQSDHSLREWQTPDKIKSRYPLKDVKENLLISFLRQTIFIIHNTFVAFKSYFVAGDVEMVGSLCVSDSFTSIQILGLWWSKV